MLAEIFWMILDAVAGFFTMLLLVRTTMRAMRITFINQLGQFVLATTNWIVLPCQRVLPSIGRIDTSSLVPAWAIQAVLVLLPYLFSAREFGNPAMAIFGVLTISAFALLRIALQLLMGIVIIGAVLSWVNPYSPLAPALNTLTRPFLAPIRRFVPAIQGIDLSPLVLLLIVQVLLTVLQNAALRFSYLLFY